MGIESRAINAPVRQIYDHTEPPPDGVVQRIEELEAEHRRGLEKRSSTDQNDTTERLDAPGELSIQRISRTMLRGTAIPKPKGLLRLLRRP